MQKRTKQQNEHQKDFNNKNMGNFKPTAEQVKELYLKLDNKQLFISSFGTTKFNLVSDDFLLKMYNYLIRKVK